MDEKFLWVVLAIVLFIFLGPLKLSNIRVNNNGYRRENYRYTTPGRNQRQRQIAQDKAEGKMGQSQSQNSEQKSGVQDPEIIEDPEVTAKRNEEVCSRIPETIQIPKKWHANFHIRTEHVAQQPQKPASTKTNQIRKRRES